MTAMYYPEDMFPESFQAINFNRAQLYEAYTKGTILCGIVSRITSSHGLIITLGYGMEGFIPHEEAALGIKDDFSHDKTFLCRVGKPVCFRIKRIQNINSFSPKIILSRAEAQKEALKYFMNDVPVGTVIPAIITNINNYFGVFCDIGCGINSIIRLSNIAQMHVYDPKKDIFHQGIGEKIYVAIKSKDYALKRVILTHKELLGSWEENSARFNAGETVVAQISSVTNSGVFIALSPNLIGLAEVTNKYSPGKKVKVLIKSIQPQKQKIKLKILGLAEQDSSISEWRYFQTFGNIYDHLNQKT